MSRKRTLKETATRRSRNLTESTVHYLSDRIMGISSFNRAVLVGLVLLVFSTGASAVYFLPVEDSWYEITNAETGEPLNVGDVIMTGTQSGDSCYIDYQANITVQQGRSPVALVSASTNVTEDCDVVLQDVFAWRGNMEDLRDSLNPGVSPAQARQLSSSSDGDEPSSNGTEYWAIQNELIVHTPGYACAGWWYEYYYDCSVPESWTETETRLYYGLNESSCENSAEGRDCRNSWYIDHYVRCDGQPRESWIISGCQSGAASYELATEDREYIQMNHFVDYEHRSSNSDFDHTTRVYLYAFGDGEHVCKSGVQGWKGQGDSPYHNCFRWEADCWGMERAERGCQMEACEDCDEAEYPDGWD